MSRPHSTLPPSLGESFTVAEARAAGVTAKRLRQADLAAPFRGVRQRSRVGEAYQDAASEARALRDEILRRAAALALVAAPGAFFSHLAAAVVWGLPLPLRVLRMTLGERGVDLSVMAPRRAPKGTGVRGHQLDPAMTGVRRRGAHLVTSPATTFVHLAQVLTVDELIAVGDAIVHIPRRRGMERGTPADALGTLEQLAAAVGAGRRLGAAKLREALPRVRVGSASPSETRIRVACARAVLPEPELDVDIFAADGTPIGYTEIAFPEFRLLVESEGDHHRVDREQWDRDIEKHHACAAAGWTVLRLTGRHIYPSPAPAVERIRAALVRAGWRPSAGAEADA